MKIHQDFNNNKHIEYTSYFNKYFQILFYTTTIEENNIQNNIEYISTFLTNKIASSLINNTDYSKDTIEFIETLIKYFMKSIENTYNLITYCNNTDTDTNITPMPTNNNNYATTYTNKSTILINFIINKLTKNINNSLMSNNQFISLFSHSENTIKLIKLLGSMHKTLGKVYSYNIYNIATPLLSDILTMIISKNDLIDTIKLQRAFTLHYINNILKERISANVDNKSYNIEEVFDLMKMLIKDNYNFLIIFKGCSNSNIVDISLFENSGDNNFFFCLKEINNNLFNKSFNDELKLFTNVKSISRRKIVYLLDLIIKYHVYLKKLYYNLEANIGVPSKKEYLKKSLAELSPFIEKNINSYSGIIMKELFSSCADELFNLFSYDSLNSSSLSEEGINKTFTAVKKGVLGLFSDFDSVKVSSECERNILNVFILGFVDKLISELEKSLKKNPKNKLLGTLKEKMDIVLDILLNRNSVDQNTLNSVNERVSTLKSYLTLLNMNKI